MGLFRMLCVHFQSYIPPLEKLMFTLMLIQYAVMLGIIASLLNAIQNLGSTDALEFCRGYSTRMTQVLMNITLEEQEFGMVQLHATILFLQSFIILEFICYLVVYWSLREQNKSFINIVQEDVLKARTKKNTITLSGQAITFLVEVTFSILLQISVHFVFGLGALTVAGLVAMGAITASQILSSPELRRFVQEKLRRA